MDFDDFFMKLSSASNINQYDTSTHNGMIPLVSDVGCTLFWDEVIQPVDGFYTLSIAFIAITHSIF